MRIEWDPLQRKYFEMRQMATAYERYQWEPSRAFEVAIGDVVTDEELDHFGRVKDTRRSAKEFIRAFIEEHAEGNNNEE